MGPSPKSDAGMKKRSGIGAAIFGAIGLCCVGAGLYVTMVPGGRESFEGLMSFDMASALNVFPSFIKGVNARANGEDPATGHVTSGFNQAVAKDDPMAITETVFFEVYEGEVSLGTIEMGLYGNAVPRTVKNFSSLCTGFQDTHGMIGYAGSTFHRIIPGFMLQGGDFTKHNGTGGKSIYGAKFADENFKIKHSEYCLSMANSGANTNGSQFFITTSVPSWLDNQHVVFGTVTSGRDVVKKIEKYGTPGGKPKKTITIKNAGSRDT